MLKLKNKYLITIIGFYIFWLGILPIILTNAVTVFCNNISHNSNFEIAVKNPHVSTYIIPVIKLKAENFSIKHKNSSTNLKTENASIKLRILPLLSGKLHINKFYAENIHLTAELKKGMTLNKNFFKNQKNAKIFFDSVIINNIDAKFTSQETKTPVSYHGKKLNYNHKNRYISIKTDSYLTTNDKNSQIYLNLFLPKNNDMTKTNFDINVSNLNIEPVGAYFKNFLPDNITGLQGNINVKADKNELITEFNKVAILMKESDSSITFPEKLVTKSVFNIRKDSINISSLEIISKNIHCLISGKIKDYFGKTMPTTDLKIIINKSKVEDLINMLPPFAVEEFNSIKLKKYKFYGDIIGNLAIKGRFPEPDIHGSVFIDNGVLIKPIPDSIKGATVKLSFTGRHAGYDIAVPAGGAQKVWVKGVQEIYNVKYADLTVKSTPNVNLHSAQNVVNPLHEILNFIIGPVPILDIYGTGNIDITVKGNRITPHVWGSLNFYNTSVNFLEIPDLKLINTDATLNFNDTNAIFKTLKGTVNDRVFKLNGTCDLNGNFNFTAESANQQTAKLYRAILTSSMIDDIKKIMPHLDSINGLTDFKLKIYGSVKNIEDLAFNKNTFVKGDINIKNNNFISNGMNITNTNADIKLDGTTALTNVKALIGDSPLYINAKIKNDIGDLIITIPHFNPNILFKEPEYKNKNYLPPISVNAKYKGNINNIEYDKLNFNAKILEHNSPALFIFKTGDFSLDNNKLNIKNLNFDIKDSKNNIRANFSITNPFTKNPIPHGVIKFNLADLKVLNEIFGEKILPENIHNILKDYEFERGSFLSTAQFYNGKLSTDCDLSGIAFNYIPQEMPVEILNGKLSVRNNTIKLNKINILADNMPILADGEIKDIKEKKNFDIYINSKPRQDFIDKFINKNRIYPIKIKGDIIYNAVLKGIPDDYSMNAKIDMNKDSSIYYYGATVGDLENAIVINLDSKIQNKNDIRIKEFLYDKLISSQNGKQTRLNMLKVKGGIKLLNKDIEFKDLYIKTSNPTDAKIFNILFGKPNIKQGQFTSDLKMKGKLSNPKIIGDFHIVETNIPFLDTTMKNIEFLFKDKSIEIYSKGEIFGSDIEAKAVLKNKLTRPYHIENAVIKTKEMNLNRYADKIKLAEAENTQFQDNFGVFDINSIIADNLILKADNISLRNIHATDFEAETSLNKQHLFEIKNFIFNIAQGTLNGKYSYNLNDNTIKLALKADSISANDITWAIFDLQNQIYGDMTGNINLSCNGETFEKCMQTLNGETSFNVKNGRMPKLGSLEHLLKAGNLLKGGITSLSINNVIDVISPLKTGDFSDIFGNIIIKEGIANAFEITTEGKDLNLFISGIYDFSNSNADMQVYGLLSRKVSTMLGPIGNLSVNTLFNIIPGVDLSRDSSILDKVNKIPGIEISGKAYRKFIADIKGNINGEDYVKSFKWIN